MSEIRPKSVVLQAAERAWPGVWHAHDDNSGKVTLVGDFSVIAKYVQGTRQLEWELDGCKNKRFCALLLHFLNGGS